MSSIFFKNPNTGVNEDFLYQWDLNVSMDVEIKNCTEAEAVFANANTELAIRRNLIDKGDFWSCTVPDILLQESLPLTISIAYVDTNWRKTIFTKKVLVKKQPKPSGYITHDDPEYIDIEVLMTRLNNTVEDVETAIEQAGIYLDSVPQITLNAKTEIEKAADNAIHRIPVDYQKLDALVRKQIAVDEDYDDHTKIEFQECSEEFDYAMMSDISDLKQDLAETYNEVFAVIVPEWEYGAISSSTGSPWGESSNKRVRTLSISKFHAIINADVKYPYYVHYYNPTGWIGSSLIQVGHFDIASLNYYKTASYFRVSTDTLPFDIDITQINNNIVISDADNMLKGRIDKVETEIKSISDDVSGRVKITDAENHLLISENLIGSDFSTFYPVDFSENTTITVYKKDGSIIPANSTLKILAYNGRKVLVDTISINSGMAYKAFTATKFFRYLAWSEQPDTEYMAEVGLNQRADNYKGYFTEARYLLNTFEKTVLSETKPTGESVVEYPIDNRYKYVISAKEIYKGRDIKVYTAIGSTYKRATVVNIHTGDIVNDIYQIGDYLVLGTDGAEKIKLETNYYAYASKPVTISVKKLASTPYIHNIHRNSEYIPTKNAFDASIALPYCFGAYDGYAYGYSDTEIKRANLSTKAIETFYTSSGNINSAMIFSNGNIVYINKADNKAYLLKNGVSTSIRSFYDSSASMSLLPNRLFSMHTCDNIGIMCQYNGSKAPRSGYMAFLTKDYGETWTTLFNLEAVVDNPSVRNYHLHTVVYDKYGDMYWAVSGDETNVDMIWYSLDGTKWYKSNTKISNKATEVIPMRDCVVFVSDTECVSTMRWNRTVINAGDTLYFDMIAIHEKQWNEPCPIGSVGIYDEKENVAYYSYWVDTAILDAHPEEHPIKYGVIYGTDGYHNKVLYVPRYIGGTVGMFLSGRTLIVAKVGNIYIFNIN